MYGVKSDRNRFILPWVLSRTLYSHNKVMKMKIKCYILRKLIRDSVPNFFYWGHLLHNKYLHFKLPKDILQPKPHSLYEYIKHSVPCFLLWELWGSSWNTSFPVLVVDHICSCVLRTHSQNCFSVSTMIFFQQQIDSACVYLTVRHSGYWCTQTETLGNQKDVLLFLSFHVFLIESIEVLSS